LWVWEVSIFSSEARCKGVVASLFRPQLLTVQRRLWELIAAAAASHQMTRHEAWMVLLGNTIRW
jgi:hypothetical protein